MPKLTKAKLAEFKKRKPAEDNRINVGMSTCGIAAGADEVYKLLQKETQSRKIDIVVKQCGCAGKCYAEPLVEVAVKGMPTVTYGRVDTAVALEIIEKHILRKELLNNHIYEAKNE